MPAPCDFCAIARGEAPDAVIVAEGIDWLAFFPLDPATRGHTLVIPRVHVPDFWSAEPGLAASVATAALEVGRAIQDALAPEGMNLITSSGTAAEQTVFHLHLHLVPRWRTDHFGKIWPPERHSASDVSIEAARQIRSAYEVIIVDHGDSRGDGVQ